MIMKVNLFFLQKDSDLLKEKLELHFEEEKNFTIE